MAGAGAGVIGGASADAAMAPGAIGFGKGAADLGSDAIGGLVKGPAAGPVCGSGKVRLSNRTLPVWLNVFTGSASAMSCSMFFRGACCVGVRVVAAGGRNTTPCRAGIVFVLRSMDDGFGMLSCAGGVGLPVAPEGTGWISGGCGGIGVGPGCGGGVTATKPGADAGVVLAASDKAAGVTSEGGDAAGTSGAAGATAGAASAGDGSGFGRGLRVLRKISGQGMVLILHEREKRMCPNLRRLYLVPLQYARPRHYNMTGMSQKQGALFRREALPGRQKAVAYNVLNRCLSNLHPLSPAPFS